MANPPNQQRQIPVRIQTTQANIKPQAYVQWLRDQGVNIDAPSLIGIEIGISLPKRAMLIKTIHRQNIAIANVMPPCRIIRPEDE